MEHFNRIRISKFNEDDWDREMKIYEFKLAMQLWHSIALVLFFVESAIGQSWLDTKTDSLIRSGIASSIQHDYLNAESVFQRLIEDFPDHPVGYFFMAATIQSKMLDYESDQWSQDFYRYIRLAIDSAKKNEVELRAHDLWSSFFHGSALCYLAFYEGRKGDYLKAVSHGLSGISILKKINKIDPQFHDAGFGIGSYKYWRSQKTKFLNWLPLVSDDREEGIELVREAVEHGEYTKCAAMNELIWILLDAGKAEEAYGWALKGLEKFPQSRFFLWGASKTSFALEDYSASATHFGHLLDSIIDAPFDNCYNEYLCRLKLAQCFEKLDRLADALAQIQMIESLPLSAEIEKKLTKQRKELSQLKTKLTFIVKREYPADSSITKYDLADKQCSQ